MFSFEQKWCQKNMEKCGIFKVNVNICMEHYRTCLYTVICFTTDIEIFTLNSFSRFELGISPSMMAHYFIFFVSLIFALMVKFSHGSGDVHSSHQAGALVRATLGIDSEIPMPNGTSAYTFNSLWPSDTIWRQGFGSTLAQVMTLPEPMLTYHQ